LENKEKYTQAFVKSFSVDPTIAQTLAYNEFPAWDSLGHMGLIAEIEEVFGIQMEMDDIIDFSSYQKGIELLSKYGVSF
jgi:acyl carrier protein